jgi:hypothetical protein
MRVKIEFTIDNLDADAWAREYNLDKQDVREDVKSHIVNGAIDDLRARGFLPD